MGTSTPSTSTRESEGAEPRMMSPPAKGVRVPVLATPGSDCTAVSTSPRAPGTCAISSRTTSVPPGAGASRRATCVTETDSTSPMSSRSTGAGGASAVTTTVSVVDS